MIQNWKELTEETERLKSENAKLRQQLRITMESAEAIKNENIDALVIADEKNLKVFTEKTADKPYRILIENMNEGAVTLNEDGTIIYCNSYFANMLNLPLQKVIGTVFKNYIDDPSGKHFEALLNQGLKNAVKEEVHIHAGDGKAIPALMNVNALSLDNISVFSIILTDLTIQFENQERLKHWTKQLEEKNRELESANKELAFQIEEKDKRGAELNIAVTDVKELEGLNTHKESIIATLAHDLRSPLAGIIGLAELLKDNYETFENSTVKEMLDLIYKSTTDELIMLDYLVEWARIKYLSDAYSPARIELSQYIEKVFDTFNENAFANNIQLKNEIEENFSVFADGKMLLSIIQNIISNSIKHTRAGGKITVTAKRIKGKIIIEIKDNGAGMTEETMKNLFTPQIDSLSNASKEDKGAGIGLLLVKSFLEKNGGEIWVESIEGEGSSFYFTLPVNGPKT